MNTAGLLLYKVVDGAEEQLNRFNIRFYMYVKVFEYL